MIMKKKELIEHIANYADISQATARAALEGAIDGITSTLAQKQTVQITGFGTFSTSERNAREGRNPQTGEPIKIAASTVASFKSGANLKNAINNK